VGPNLVVVGRVFCEDSPKVLGVEHRQMVRALASDRADQAFNISALPLALGRRRGGLNRSAINVARRWMIANIVSDDALLLPHRAKPTGLNFRERQLLCGDAYKAKISQIDPAPV